MSSSMRSPIEGLVGASKVKEGSLFLAKGDVIEMHGYFSATERVGHATAVVCDTTKARNVFRVKALCSLKKITDMAI